jgi:hypothetical protein
MYIRLNEILNHNNDIRQYVNQSIQFKINKNRAISSKINKNKPINLSGTDFKNPNKNKKNHSGKILSDVFNVLTITHDSS